MHCRNDLEKIELTDEQKEVLIGNLLGDGHLLKLRQGDKNSRFSISQKISSSEYIKYLFQVYQPFVTYYNEGQYKLNKKEHSYCRIISKSLPVFTFLRNKWYIEDSESKKSRKVVPLNISLTWRIVAFWSLDDGSNNIDRRLFSLCTHGFSKKEVYFLTNRLKVDLGVNANVCKHYDKYIINVRSNSYEMFIDNIKPYIEHIKCFNYKIISRKSNNPNTSGFVGVTFEKQHGVYIARGSFNGKRIYLGSFSTLKEAVIERQKFNKNPQLYEREIKLIRRNNSGTKGISFHKGKKKWIARNGKKWVGTFKTKEEAINSLLGFRQAYTREGKIFDGKYKN